MISFCVTCRNRLWQLEQTLPPNLAALGPRDEICLVDYGSRDGLSAWVWAHFGDAVASGRLRFFEVTDPVEWNVAKAKNLAHRVASGSYLFNLDADNWLHPDEVALVEKAARRGVFCHQFSGVLPDGSYGRIGIPRERFRELGGYDEQLALNIEDRDLLERALALGWPGVRLPPPRRTAIANTFEQRMAEAGGARKDRQAYNAIAQRARSLAAERRAREGPRRLGGFPAFHGLLNGRPVRVEEFDRILPAG